MSTTAATPPTVSAPIATVPHFKTWGFVGQHSLERCEDPGCRVSSGGRAGCGRLACPACGFSGSNLTDPSVLEGLTRCTCGHVFDAQSGRTV
jgi:hypothetical protein